MTPTEFTAYAERWPSVQSLAADLGVHRATVYLYLKGERPVPEPTARLLRIISADPQAKELML